ADHDARWSADKGDAGARVAGQRTKTPPQRLRRPPTPPSFSLLDYDLPIHPRVRCADVEVCPRFGEGDGLRFPLIEWAGIPIADFALVERGRRVRNVPDIGEGHRCPGLDPSAGRPIGILDIVVANLDLVDPVRDRAAGPSSDRRRER